MSDELAQLEVLAIAAPSASGALPALQERLRPLVERLDLISPRSVEALQEAVARSAGTYGALCVLGGDGTINRVVNAMDLPRQKLIILPTGRGNDFARMLRLPLKLKPALARLPHLSFREVDVGMAGSIRFVNSAGLGLDAEVLRLMERSRGLCRRNYLFAFILTLARLRPLKLSCDLFPRASSGRCWWVVAMNGRWIGGGIPIAPQASLQDGKLDALAVTAGGRWTMMLKLLPVLRQQHLQSPEVEFAQRSSFEVGELEAPFALEVDGELYSCQQSRLSFHSLPAALTILC
ncbi:MAG: hypothetical protein B1H03_02315 [Planctomycetales bacterium 4484_113]|nr:MAG: hypothetical protein B1H03_02315 [Planctomycetales bacterium 4484_113]